LNKQHVLYFTTVLIAILIIAPGIAGAAPKVNAVHGVYHNVNANQAAKILENKGVFLLDVRTPAEYKYSHIAGAKLIPFKNVPSFDSVNLPDSKLLPKRMNELPKNKNTIILVYCYSGHRSEPASQMIADAGYKNVYNLKNGLPTWVTAGYPVVMNPATWSAHYPPNK
jgi:rhodanese-related sulfurtransferase